MKIDFREKPSLYLPALEEFLAYPPYSEEAFHSAKQKVLTKSFARSEIVKTLTEYNQLIGNDDLAQRNIQRLTDKQSFVIVSGQQLGLMGGPAYTVLKGLSCLLLAKKTGAVPIFWLATEDHDLHEVDHTFLIDSLGNLKEFKVHLGTNSQHRSLDSLELTDKNREVMKQFLDAINCESFDIYAYKNYAAAMAGFMAHLFKGTGLIFLEPKILRPLGKNFFQKEIEASEEILKVLRSTASKLIKAGGEALLPVEESPQLFFITSEKKRERLILSEGRFYAGKEEFSLKELLKLLSDDPYRFSANAASRPIFQSAILPVAAYIAGPSELKYFRQLKDYYAFHDIPMPWILPRISATFIPKEGAKILERLRLKPWETIPSHWGTFYSDVEPRLAGLQNQWEELALKTFPEELSKKSLNTFLKHQMGKMEKMVFSKRLKSEGIPSNALHYLRNLISPHNTLQERVLNFCNFQKEGPSILKLLELLNWENKGHLFISD